MIFYYIIFVYNIYFKLAYKTPLDSNKMSVENLSSEDVYVYMNMDKVGIVNKDEKIIINNFNGCSGNKNISVLDWW